MLFFNPTHEDIRLNNDDLLALNKSSFIDSVYLERVNQLLKEKFSIEGYLVHTCTTALEIAAMALELKPGDEVILPSYTFVSTANAFARLGCSLKFVDVDQNMNISIEGIKLALSPKTRVIVPVHYAGASCNMDSLMAIAEEYNLYVIEDAAQSFNSQYKGKYLGAFGHLACMSFHSTKNISCGEGGLLIVNDETLRNRVEMIINNGTDKLAFTRGEVPKYTWQGIGTSAMMDHLRAYILYKQLKRVDEITTHRLKLISLYRNTLAEFDVFKEQKFNIENGHIFFIMTKSQAERNRLVDFLEKNHIQAYSHYEPLHLSEFGKKYAYIGGDNTLKAYRLLRLPLHHEITEEDVLYICHKIKEFYYG